MLGLDTNVLVRYLVQDDPAQAAIATRAIVDRCSRDTPGFISQLVLIELSWVLSTAYGYDKSWLMTVLTGLLRSAELRIEDTHEVWTALRAYEAGGADFADYLIGMRARSAGCDAVLTFDKRAGQSLWHEALA